MKLRFRKNKNEAPETLANSVEPTEQPASAAADSSDVNQSVEPTEVESSDVNQSVESTEPCDDTAAADSSQINDSVDDLSCTEPVEGSENPTPKKKKAKKSRSFKKIMSKMMPFTILDRYILRKFLGTYVFSILLLLAIVIVFDINEKLDAFLKAPLSATLKDYYLNFLPYFANQFSPLFTFIAVIFFTSKLAGNSEIIAMLSTGMSFKRLLRPYLFGATVIAIFTFLLSAYVIPPANVKRIAYENTYVKNKRVDYGANIMLMVAPNEIAYMNHYDNISKTGAKFSLESFDSQKRMVSRLTAQTIAWDTLYSWRAYDYVIRDFKKGREYITRGRQLDTIIPFEPRDFLISANDHEKLTTPQLVNYIQRQKNRGVGNIQSFEVEFHRRFAMTAAAFILTIIGMSLSSRKVKGGMGLNIGIGLVLSFSYILFMTVTQTFALSGLTSAFVAMWIPNILYLIIAVSLYYRASK